jgi:hypothetical protein
VAAGGEKYMMLGNFKSNALTNTMIINPTYLPISSADILIDDVSLIELELPAFAGNDTSVVPGDSVFLGRVPELGLDELCTWYKAPSLVPIDTIAGFWINPVTTSTYIVRQEICGKVKWDTVVVHMDLVGVPDHDQLQKQITLWPNPSNNRLSITSVTPGFIRDFSFLALFNSAGELIYKEVLKDGNSIQLITENLPDGIYFVELGGAYSVRKRFVVHHGVD